MKKSFVFLLLIYIHSFEAQAQMACQRTIQEQPPLSVKIRGQEVEDLQMTDVTEKNDHKKIMASALDLNGRVMYVSIVDHNLTQVVALNNIEMDMNDYLKEKLEMWRSGVYDHDEALHFTTPQTLQKVRGQKDENVIREVFSADFIQESKIADPSLGLYSPQSVHRDESHQVLFKLNSQGQLVSMDFGYLPMGLYKMTLVFRDQGTTQLLFEIQD